MTNSDAEHTDGDLLEREGEALADIFNEASGTFASELTWFCMSSNRDVSHQSFVFEADDYIDGDGLKALRDRGWRVQYIEAYEFDGQVKVQIDLPVRGEVP
jgi:hypothetical protein